MLGGRIPGRMSEMFGRFTRPDKALEEKEAARLRGETPATPEDDWVDPAIEFVDDLKYTEETGVPRVEDEGVEVDGDDGNLEGIPVKLGMRSSNRLLGISGHDIKSDAPIKAHRGFQKGNKTVRGGREDKSPMV